MRKALITLAAVVVGLCTLAGCAEKRILLITQYHEGHPRVDRIEKAVARRLNQEHVDYQLVTFNMSALNHPTEIWRTEMANMAILRVHAIDPDIILVAGDEAARHFARRLVDMSTPFIFFDLKSEPSAFRLTSAAHATGIREKVHVQKAFALMKQLVPYATRAAVLADDSAEADAVVQQIEAARDLPIPVVAVRRAATFDDWKIALRDLQDKADVLCIGPHSTVLAYPSKPQAVPPRILLDSTSKLSRLPDFSFWKEAVRPNGVLTAVTVPLETQAAIAADIAAKVLYYDENIEDFRIITPKAHAVKFSLERATVLRVAIPATLLTPPPRTPAQSPPQPQP